MNDELNRSKNCIELEHWTHHEIWFLVASSHDSNEMWMRSCELAKCKENSKNSFWTRCTNTKTMWNHWWLYERHIKTQRFGMEMGELPAYIKHNAFAVSHHIKKFCTELLFFFPSFMQILQSFICICLYVAYLSHYSASVFFSLSFCSLLAFMCSKNGCAICICSQSVIEDMNSQHVRKKYANNNNNSSVLGMYIKKRSVWWFELRSCTLQKMKNKKKKKMK